MTPIPTLITDLEKLDRPCREMDARIAEATDEPIIRGGFHLGNGFYSFSTTMLVECPKFTASTDAALAMAERVLPADYIGIGKMEKVNELWMVDIYGQLAIGISLGEHKSLAIAICIATLRALEQKEAGDG